MPKKKKPTKRMTKEQITKTRQKFLTYINAHPKGTHSAALCRLFKISGLSGGKILGGMHSQGLVAREGSPNHFLYLPLINQQHSLPFEVSEDYKKAVKDSTLPTYFIFIAGGPKHGTTTDLDEAKEMAQTMAKEDTGKKAYVAQVMFSYHTGGIIEETY